MREETRNWWKQANADYETAVILFEKKRYYFASFACQQSIEKGLKALYLDKYKKMFQGHSLVYLAKELKVPETIFDFIADLNLEYTATRYPDIAQAAPVDVYTKTNSQDHLNKANQVLQWIKKQIEK